MVILAVTVAVATMAVTIVTMTTVAVATTVNTIVRRRGSGS
jgi:hypothetical protein